MHVKRIHEMVEKLTCAAEAEFAKGLCEVNTCEMGQVVDMIKDLCCAEKDAYECKFYKKMVEAFGEDGAAAHRHGYDNWRYSSGRFAPKGQGHMAGYMPMPTTWDKGDQYNLDGMADMPKHRLGYMDTDRMDRNRNMHDRPYDKWSEARRHYHESGRREDKDMMDKHANEHVMETVSTMKEIWEDADPQMKVKMKGELEELMRMMK